MKIEEQEDRPKLEKQFSFLCSRTLRRKVIEVSRRHKKSLSSTIRTLIKKGLEQEES
jgi:hypothetical protein